MNAKPQLVLISFSDEKGIINTCHGVIKLAYIMYRVWGLYTSHLPTCPTWFKCCSHCNFIKTRKFPLQYLRCLAIPQISSTDKSILHLLMDIYLLYRYDHYKDWHWRLVCFVGFFLNKTCFQPINYCSLEISNEYWVPDTFYVFFSLSKSYIQLFPCKMYPKIFK